MSIETQTESNPSNAPANGPVFIDEKELLARLPVSRRTLWQWREDGKIPCVRVPGGRRVIYHLPSVEAALLRLQKGGAR
jgi:predicted site-specific integrase-resolvase